MKHILFVFLFYLSVSSQGQERIDYKIDANTSIRIPEYYEVKDTMGQKIIKAPVYKGMILVSIYPFTGEIATNIEDEKELVKFYDGYQNGVIQSLRGNLISEEIIDRDGLKFKSFSFSLKSEGEAQVRNCLVLFLKENVYSVQFWYLESMKDAKKTEIENLFYSFKVKNGITFKDQLSFIHEKSSSYKWGFLIGNFIAYGLAIVLFICMVAYLSKKISQIIQYYKRHE